MRYALALVCAACVLALTPFALADQGNSTPTQPTASCTSLKRVYSEKRWRERKPERGFDLCPVENKAGARSTVAHFYLYRHYREITPYRCLPGREGTFAIPCYIIECESHFNWWAMNSSGAAYIYQLLGWGAPPPSTFRNRVRNHEIAASLSLSNWACA
jgi:hypothetical protein